MTALPISPTTRRHGTLAAATAWLALLALLAGAVGFHADADHHAVVAPTLGAQAATVEACAPDHAQRSHYERLRKAERDDCAACLHRHFHQADAGAIGAPATLSAGGAAPAAPRFDLAQAPLDHSPSRGPPAA